MSLYLGHKLNFTSIRVSGNLCKNCFPHPLTMTTASGGEKTQWEQRGLCGVFRRLYFSAPSSPACGGKAEFAPSEKGSMVERKTAGLEVICNRGLGICFYESLAGLFVYSLTLPTSMEPKLHESSHLIFLVHCCVLMPTKVLAHSRCSINNCEKLKMSGLVSTICYAAFSKPSLLPPLLNLSFPMHKMKRLDLLFSNSPTPQLLYSRSPRSWPISEWRGKGLSTDRALISSFEKGPGSWKQRWALSWKT